MLCIGQSHMGCVLAAADGAGMELTAIALKDFGVEAFPRSDVLVVRRARSLTPELVNSQGGPVFSFVGGVSHLVLGLRPHPQPFDFVLPEAPELPFREDAELVPVDAMRRALRERIAGTLRSLERIVELAEAPVYHFESPPPPPVRGLSVKLERLRNDARKPKKKKKKKEKDPTAEPRRSPTRFLRYKLWRLHSEIVREHAESIGARFVSAPAEAADDEGFLRLDLTRNGTHANDRYGALLLEQMKALR